MKKILFALTLIATAAPTLGIEPFKGGYYVTLQGGGNYKYTQLDHNEHLTNDLGVIGSFAVGMRNKLNTRYELEFSYRYNTLDKYKGHSIKGHAGTQAYMANLVYDFPTRYFLKPYIGVGVGYARQIFSGKLNQALDNDVSLHVQRHTNSFAWQAIGGISCPFDAFDPLGYDIEGTIEYKFFNPRIKSSNDQSVAFGLRSYF